MQNIAYPSTSARLQFTDIRVTVVVWVRAVFIEIVGCILQLPQILCFAVVVTNFIQGRMYKEAFICIYILKVYKLKVLVESFCIAWVILTHQYDNG